jgi:hypothetical protein
MIARSCDEFVRAIFFGIRYIQKKRRSKPDDVWSFIENLGVRNSKTDSIVASRFQNNLDFSVANQTQ